MAKINSGSLPRATLSGPENEPASVSIEGLSEPTTGPVADAAPVAATTPTTLPQSDEGASKALTGAVKSIGEKTEKTETREALADAIEGKKEGRGKRRSRHKRAAILRSISDASSELKGKVKVRLARAGKQVRVRTETGQIVKGGLKAGEASRVLVADDGSKVLLLNRKLPKEALIQEVNKFVQETFVNAAHRNGVNISKDFFDALTAIVQSSLATVIFTETLAEMTDFGDETPEEESVRLNQEQIEREQEKNALARMRVDYAHKTGSFAI